MTIKHEFFGLNMDFVEPEDLVTIQVIKEKYLDQVEEAEVFPEDGARIVGRCRVWLVFLIGIYHPDGTVWHLRKIRDVNFIQQVVTRRLVGATEEEYPAKREVAQEEARAFLEEQCKQLFSS